MFIHTCNAGRPAHYIATPLRLNYDQKVRSAQARRNIRTALKHIVERSDTISGKIFDFFIQTFIIFSIVSFSIETLPGLSKQSLAFLNIFEAVTVAIFTIEYLLRLWVSEQRLRFVVSIYGLIDIIAIAPYYLTGFDLRSLRALRLLRIFKLFRYSQSIDLFARTFHLIRDELILFGATALIVLYLAAAGIYFFEHDAQPEIFRSVLHSLWWAVTTLTYGWLR